MSLNSSIKPWTHQRAALRYMLEQKSGILNAGMGTGKTLTALMLIDAVGAGSVLIVAKSKHSLAMWREKIVETLGHDYMVVDDNDLTIKEQAKRLDEYGHMDVPLIYLTTYPRLWRPELMAMLIDTHFDVMIADESHKLNAANSNVSKAAHKIGKNIQYRWGLTGTLIVNEPMGIFGQARFVNDRYFDFPDGPKLLKAFGRFRTRYCILRPISPTVSIIAGYKNLEEFNAEVGKFVYRIKSEDVIDLKPENHIKIPVELPPAAMNVYKKFKADTIVTRNGKTITAKNILVKGLRLRQMAGGFVQYDDKTEEYLHDAKLEALEDLVDGLPADEPVVVFAEFTPEIDRIKERLQDYGPVSELSGNKDELAVWQQGKSRILVVQISTGAEAIDLTRSHYTIYYSLNYSLGVYLQSLARTNRPGQKSGQVYYYYLLAKGTIDHAIMTALENKEDVADSVLDYLGGWDAAEAV